MAAVGAVPPLRDCASNFADLPHLAVLDGGPGANGRWTYLAADPARCIWWDADAGDGFAGLTALRGPDDRHPDWPAPFSGGAIGYLAYDAVFALETLRVLPAPAPAGYLWAGIYDRVIARDEATGEGWVTATNHGGRDPRQLVDEARARLATPPARPREVRASGVTTNLDRAAYGHRVRRVLDYIAAGDCYQVNLARRLTLQCQASSLDVYRQLVDRHPAPFGALIRAGPVDIVSASPELFIRSNGRRAVARPIKGTRPRSRDPAEDRRRARALRVSAKDRAENVMIVDVMRNDFGRVCTPGSVRAPILWSVEPHPTVWQLVSVIRGELAEGATSVDLLRACAPSGSVTGAPKLRAIEIIDELEPERRGVYCGSVFRLGFDGALTASVAIRTLQLADGRASLDVGAGIVADSDPDLEFDETSDKARGILAALGARE
ncbi:MAG: aminodeoxychorismate synthase component I [Chloroflexi bacterium]|nr:aminodeoxychorismate synthase component I [Chloroflexota bacterium]